MMPGGSKRRGTLTELILRDPWRKLASLALAVCLWLWLLDKTTEVRGEKGEIALALSKDALAAGDRPPGNQLSIRLDGSEHMVTGFTAPGDPDNQVTSVSLVLRGIRQHLLPLDARAGFGLVITPGPEDLLANQIDIAAEDLKMSDPDLRNLDVSMDPPRVIAHLAPVGRRTLNLSLANVELLYPEVPGIRERVVEAQALFTPALITLVGPQPALQRLTEQKILQAQLEVGDGNPEQSTGMAVATVLPSPELEAMGIRIANPIVELHLPLRNKPENHELEITPLLDFTTVPEQREKWRAQPVKITLSVWSPALNQFLTNSNRDEWIKQHCRLLVDMATFDPQTKQAELRFLIYRGSSSVDFLRGSDFEFVLTDLLRIEEK